MRGTRWLLLVAIAAILGGVGISYRAQKKVLRDQAAPKPQPLPPELTSFAPRYEWKQSRPDGSRYVMNAEDYRQQKDTGRLDLKNVDLKLFNKNGKTYDLVRSAAAQFFEADNRFHTEGEVEITLDVPVSGPQANQTLVSIKSSGVMLDTATGRVDTDRPATFVFRNGEGKATGAFYDPAGRELVMKSEVELHWKAEGPSAKPMKIEAGSLAYHEATSEIWLKPWGRVTRENSVVEGRDDIVRLAESGGRRYIRQIEANAARGTDAYPKRKLQYSADSLWVDFNEGGETQKITGAGNAQLVSTAETSETSVKAYRVDLNFDIHGNESVLSTVNASGGAEAVSKPLPAPGRQPSETHILRAANFDMKMRPDGREVESVVTHSPGQLEFLPNLPTQHRRTVDGNDFAIAYAPQNRVESFRAKDARTRTEPTGEERKRNRAVSVTTSREMLARFDPATGQPASLEQSGDFTYQEGQRRARAAKATLDSQQNVILLETAARVWDETGSTSSDRIRMDQRNGNFTAEGHVYSSRNPDKNQKTDSQMLSGDEPLLAQALRMESTNNNRTIHYEGDAVMRQGANQIQGDAIDVNRDKRTLIAVGNVVTNLWEQPKSEQPKPGQKKSAAPPSPVLTVVRASRMVYTDENRLAYYSGGVTLQRAGLHVKSSELRAFLSESGADSSLEKAICDGGVEMVQTAPGHTRTGTGEHSEYYAAEQKVILRGRHAKLVDTVKGTTEGLELIYWANDDRLLVNGAPDDPVRSRIVRDRK
jgi:lipopolysaccharide export system protein LptA